MTPDEQRFAIHPILGHRVDEDGQRVLVAGPAMISCLTKEQVDLISPGDFLIRAMSRVELQIEGWE